MRLVSLDLAEGRLGHSQQWAAAYRLGNAINEPKMVYRKASDEIHGFVPRGCRDGGRSSAQVTRCVASARLRAACFL